VGAVRTLRVWGPLSVGNTAVLAYTVPADRTLILRGWSSHDRTGAAWRQHLDLDSGGGVHTIADMAGAAGASAYDANWRVFNPGDKIYCEGEAADSCWSMGFGVLLPGPPT